MSSQTLFVGDDFRSLYTRRPCCALLYLNALSPLRRRCLSSTMHSFRAPPARDRVLCSTRMGLCWPWWLLFSVRLSTGSATAD
ncbi:unnamed protein product [Toxocara canis]|uniref:Uncharacterized protein n=1 Tax=Toxocara canis TaxID=6265 RepID=A0A183V8Y0_TOXCA|nr:unnamed protein product [Toxocara canis]